jgi:PAS domain S-box-containing protein
MSPDARGGDREAPIRPPIAQTHRRDAGQARAVRQVRWPSRVAAQPKPMQRRTATGFQIRLIPHSGQFRQAVAESKPRREDQAFARAKAPPERTYFDMSDNANADDAKALVEQYRRIADAAITDAGTWLRQGALSRAIPEAMPDAIMVTDEAGVIVSVNAKFELMFGYHRSEVIGRLPEMLMPEAVRVRHMEHRGAYAENPRVRDMSEGMKLHGLRKNGVEFDALIKLGPVVIPDGIYTIVIIRKIRD